MSKDTILIEIINSKSLKKDSNGYYYSVPVSVRRNGQFRVSDKKVNQIIKKLNQ